MVTKSMLPKLTVLVLVEFMSVEHTDDEGGRDIGGIGTF